MLKLTKWLLDRLTKRHNKDARILLGMHSQMQAIEARMRAMENLATFYPPI